MGWWTNGLVYRAGALAIAMAIVPPGVVAAADALRWTTCAAPTHLIAKGAVLDAGDLTRQRVRRNALPTRAATAATARAKTASRPLPAGACVPSADLAAPAPRIPFLLTDVTLVGTPVRGGTVDLLFEPTNGQDSRGGGSVEGAVVAEIDPRVLVVEVTDSQKKTILDLGGRSRTTIRAH